MDPVLLTPLFDTIDLLATKQTAITLRDLNIKRKTSIKRFGEIGRILESFKVAHRDGLVLIPDNDLDIFVSKWELGDLNFLERVFENYKPYTDFMRFLQLHHFIRIPTSRDKDLRKSASTELQSKGANFTFVAADTFKWWGLGTGHIYISHIGDGNTYWGGAEIELASFEQILIGEYTSIRPPDGYVNIGRLADHVCRILNISFIRYEQLFAQLCILFPKRYITSTSLVRNPSTKSPVQTILPRSRAKQLAEIRDKGGIIEWTDKRYLEDGILIGNNNRRIKMVNIRKGF